MFRQLIGWLLIAVGVLSLVEGVFRWPVHRLVHKSLPPESKYEDVERLHRIGTALVGITFLLIGYSIAHNISIAFLILEVALGLLATFFEIRSMKLYKKKLS